MVLQRRGGRDTHEPGAVEGTDHQTVRAFQIGGKILAFILQIAVIEIGPVPEHADPEPRHIVERGGEPFAGQGVDLDAHATCRSQS